MKEATREQIDTFCKKIMNHRPILGKIVILCEGLRDYIDLYHPKQFKELTKLPDANFWKATIPKTWRTKRPIFLPCGGRTDVLYIFNRIKELNLANPDESYLNVKKLFALIDLDLVTVNIEDVKEEYSSTEKIHQKSYKGSSVQKEVIKETHIIVTGWIHKESYFFAPELQQTFVKNDFDVLLDGKTLILNELYSSLCESTLHCEDLSKNISNAKRRVDAELDFTIEIRKQFANNWKQKFQDSISTDPEKRRHLIEILLRIGKLKTYWQRLSINSKKHELTPSEARDALLLEIANFYSEIELDSPIPLKLHIPQWMQILREIE